MRPFGTPRPGPGPLALLGSAGALLAATAWAAPPIPPLASPAAVSPGETARFAPVGDGCPTFSWGGVAAAASYELVVWRVDTGGGEVGGDAPPVLAQQLPGSVTSWTPPLDRCPPAGGHYAWLVRARGDGAPSPWSEARLFRVAPPRAPVELEAALEVVRRYLTAGGDPAADGSAAPSVADAMRAAGAGPIPRGLNPGGGDRIFVVETGANDIAGRFKVGNDGVAGQFEAGNNGVAGQFDVFSSAKIFSGRVYQSLAGGFAEVFFVTAGGNLTGGGFGANATYSFGPTNWMINDTGIGLSSPGNRLHVRDEIAADDGQLASHVALIENAQNAQTADVLALQVGATGALAAGNNFITFFNGNGSPAGAIEGTASGVQLTSGGADYAEWLRRLDQRERLAPGDVVGLHGDAVSLRTAGAAALMVVSSGAIVAGNDPGEEERDSHVLVAFVGQVPVRVVGRVEAGDIVISSGRDDGAAIAVAPSRLTTGQARRALGRALGSAAGPGETFVRVLVGAPDPALMADLLAAREAEISALAARLEALAAVAARLEELQRAAPSLLAAAGDDD